MLLISLPKLYHILFFYFILFYNREQGISPITVDRHIEHLAEFVL